MTRFSSPCSLTPACGLRRPARCAGATYVARQLGHDTRYTPGTYGHVIDELDGQPRISAEDAIRAARGRDVRATFAN